MEHFVLDQSTAEALQKLRDQVELRNVSGEILGHFVPTFDPAEWEIETPFTEQELKEASQQRTGRPLADILRDLRAQT